MSRVRAGGHMPRLGGSGSAPDTHVSCKLTVPYAATILRRPPARPRSDAGSFLERRSPSHTASARVGITNILRPKSPGEFSGIPLTRPTESAAASQGYTPGRYPIESGMQHPPSSQHAETLSRFCQGSDALHVHGKRRRRSGQSSRRRQPRPAPAPSLVELLSQVSAVRRRTRTGEAETLLYCSYSRKALCGAY